MHSSSRNGWFALVLSWCASCLASEPAIIDFNAQFHPEYSKRGMVVSQEVVASQVGARILARGGNAVDAAVATGFALAVTLPQAGNIGGGGFMLIYLADEKRTIAVDYREMAPAAAHAQLFIDDGVVDTDKARFSHLSAAVPGTVAGLLHVLDKYGTLPLAEVMQPAIDLAQNGIEVTYPLVFSLQRAQGRLARNAASARYFLAPDGNPPTAGTRWRQRDLAHTLRLIATRGSDGFYRGETADKLVAEMGNGRGLITHQDLANYRVVERMPVSGTYRGHDIVSMPPPSSGGIHLVQMLNILEGWDLSALGHNSASYLHRLIESMRRAYADRSKYLGDPDFHPVPVAGLIDKKYATQLRAGINLNQASASVDIAPALKLAPESPQTTHYSVWDKEGNVVSNTYTLNFSYGSGISVPGAGFLLNNEMDDFSAMAGVPNAYGLVGDEANAIAGGKRPLSSMTPTLVFKNGKPVLATGSPGGSTIITIVLQVLLNTMDFGMNIAQATAMPRIHHQWLPDRVFWEAGISPDTITALREMGHQLESRPRVMGRSQSIASDGAIRYGATDTRWPGGGAAVERGAYEESIVSEQ